MNELIARILFCIALDPWSIERMKSLANEVDNDIQQLKTEVYKRRSCELKEYHDVHGNKLFLNRSKISCAVQIEPTTVKVLVEGTQILIHSTLEEMEL